MQEANYILKTKENIRVPKQDGSGTKKKAVLIITGILIAGSFLLGDNLFGELSWVSKILFLGLFAKFAFVETREFKPFPIEIYFYDDAFEIRRVDVYCDKKCRRKEIYVYKYGDVQSCVFNKQNNRMTITGNVHLKFYNYDKNGNLSDIPNREKEGVCMCMFYTHADPSVNFVEEIEKHSPIKVTEE